MKPDVILTLPAQPVPYAVVGSPINHSLSPGMQQAAFDHTGFDARYYRIESNDEALEKAVSHMRRVPFGGWNCTIPNKVRMFELCDRHAESASLFHAVNTVVNEKGTLVGHNTDGYGWTHAVQEAFGRQPGELRVLILGMGGAGRAIVTQAVLERCPTVILANRNRARADEVKTQLDQQFRGSARALSKDVRIVDWTDKALAAALREVDLVVNATSAGLDPKAPPILAAALMRPELLVLDTVYGNGCAKFRQEVETAGAKWADGLGMLLHQGAEAFRLWTGQDAPLEIMRRALRSALPA